MNETIQLSIRQKAIFNLLSRVEFLSRDEISDELQKLYPVSKATLARDLKELLTWKKIITQGNGPNLVYGLAIEHPLLKPVDLKMYFQVEADNRQGVIKSFQMAIFD